MEQTPKKMGRPSKQEFIDEADLHNMSPLDYMMSVIRDPTASKTRRDRMAIAAAPYVHGKVADIAKGKKDQQTDAAWMAGMGTAWAADLEFENRAS
jgi:phage terminase small subunit